MNDNPSARMYRGHLDSATARRKDFEKSQRGIDLPKHQSYLAIHLALCDNTKPHEHPAAEIAFAEALDDARAAGAEIERSLTIAYEERIELLEKFVKSACAAHGPERSCLWCRTPPPRGNPRNAAQ